MEHMFSTRRIFVLLVSVFGFLFIWKKLAGTASGTTAPQRQLPFQGKSPIAINPNLDEADGLTSDQCDDHFPDIFQEVDRAVDYWKKRGHTIGKADVEFHSWREWDGKNKGGAALRILIHENELRILESYGSMSHMGYRGRGMGLLYILQRAIDSATSAGEKLPTIEATIILQDIADVPDDTSHSFWTWTANVDTEAHEREWLIPNYDFWYGEPMGSYREVRRRAKEFKAPFKEKIPKVVWRGSAWTAPELRNGLADLAKGKDWADVVVADWGGGESPDGLDVEQLCGYAMTVYTEGISFSGRLKYLLACDSLPIIHELKWLTFDSHLLISEGRDQNYVQVNRNWTNLEEKVKYYLAHPKEAQRIIRNSHATFHDGIYTRAAVSCYFRRLIEGYASVSFKPEVMRAKPTKPGRIRSRRGISFERFLDKPVDDDFETDNWR